MIIHFTRHFTHNFIHLQISTKIDECSSFSSSKNSLNIKQTQNSKYNKLDLWYTLCVAVFGAELGNFYVVGVLWGCWVEEGVVLSNL